MSYGRIVLKERIIYSYMSTIKCMHLPKPNSRRINSQHPIRFLIASYFFFAKKTCEGYKKQHPSWRVSKTIHYYNEWYPSLFGDILDVMTAKIRGVWHSTRWCKLNDYHIKYKSLPFLSSSTAIFQKNHKQLATASHNEPIRKVSLWVMIGG